MSGFLNRELKLRGIAQVIVVLSSAAEGLASAVMGRSAGEVSGLDAGCGLGKIARCFRASGPGDAGPGGAIRTPGRRPASEPPIHPAGGAGDHPSPPAPGRYFPNLGVMLGTVDPDGLAALKKIPEVERVLGAPRLNLIRPRRIAAAKLTRKVTWGIEDMGIPRLWRMGLTGKGVLVGHLDTGLDGGHSALRAAVAAFAQFDDLGREVRPSPPPFDTGDHGTHTAATIAGRPVKKKHVGVAPGALLASAIVIEGGDVIARVLGGMDWAVGQGVRILSMSLGLPGWRDEFLGLIRLLRGKNILPVFAVGNEGPGTSRSPGNYPEALSVGAYDRSGNVAGFSSSQRFPRRKDPLVPDLVGPGAGVISARPGGGYQAMDGTSMATPHIAGLASLLMEAGPDKTAAEVESAIFESCSRRPGMLPERANRGVPDAERALGAL